MQCFLLLSDLQLRLIASSYTLMVQDGTLDVFRKNFVDFDVCSKMLDALFYK